jgi:hypothetical protein
MQFTFAQPRQIFPEEQQTNIAGNQHPTACTASAFHAMLVQHPGIYMNLDRKIN